MKRALELDPLSMIINSNLGQAYIYSRRLDDAIAQLRQDSRNGAKLLFRPLYAGTGLGA